MIFDFPISDVLDVHDGDSITVRLDIGFGIEFNTSIRVDGIDTPEISTKNATEKKAAGIVRDLFKHWLTKNAGKLRVRSLGWDKYGGRINGRIYTDATPSTCWTEYSISIGVAHAYTGKVKKIGWTGDELKKIITLKP